VLEGHNASQSPVVGTVTRISSNSISATPVRTSSSSSSLSSCSRSAKSTIAGKLLVLTVLWSVTLYMLFQGAANVDSVVDIPAIFSTNVNLLYIMSWVFLQRQFVSVRVLSVPLTSIQSRNYSLVCCIYQYLPGRLRWRIPANQKAPRELILRNLGTLHVCSIEC